MHELRNGSLVNTGFFMVKAIKENKELKIAKNCCLHNHSYGDRSRCVLIILLTAINFMECYKVQWQREENDKSNKTSISVRCFWVK